ncbi:hypothetical protein [Streptomyces sp. Mg1]|uniref:hypothetical protein n=1 Tax=Streptomyces sp. Mg1 TaxID=465541 RepID=UPI00017E9806|nr:hypothetical protein [Streptomyces sp. Mg1]AKL68315.1 hypothetical protein M444_26035 [Streptomyces sp. Mg1]EDX24299.1 hypothetical protein SSAG_04090 [Streptomyces sp. Mg1]
MPFPPSDMLAAQSKWLYFQGLEHKLRERHPELAHRVFFNSGGPFLYLKVKVSGESGVALAITRFGNTETWAILDPQLDGELSVWAPSTPGEVLVDSLAAHAAAHLAGVPVASPWRWHQSERSDMTDLADLLTDSGIKVRRVVAGNGWFAYGPRHEPKLGLIESSRGHHLDAELPGGVLVRVSIKPNLGWTAHVHTPEWNAWGRIDLSRALTGRERPVPGVPLTSTSVERIAEVISGGFPTWAEVRPWDPFRGYAPPSPFGFDPTEAVLAQLSPLGFGDLREGVGGALVSDSHHVEWYEQEPKTPGNLLKPELVRLNGLAAAAGEDAPKRLILITNCGLSRPAAAFADQAKAFVFRLAPDTGRLDPLNPRAQEALPPWEDPRKHDWETW